MYKVFRVTKKGYLKDTNKNAFTYLTAEARVRKLKKKHTNSNFLILQIA